MADEIEAARARLAGLARNRLGVFPTPLHPSPALGAVLGTSRLWLKRDDLTGYAWGGNKVRSIEFLLGDALERGTTDLVLAAGPSSNFAAILANAAAANGIAVHQVAYGEEPPRPVAALTAARRAGAHVSFTGSGERESMEVVADELAAALADRGRVPYRIPRGGASPVGSLGYVSAALELIAQHAALAEGAEPVALVVPLGSGGTTAGLLAGLTLANAPWEVFAMSVSRPPHEIGESVVDIAVRCAGLLGADLDSAAIAGRLHVSDARGAGFAATTRDEVEIAGRVARATGLLVDPTYNAKALLAVARGNLGAAPMIYVATGGTLGVIDDLPIGVTDDRSPMHSAPVRP